MKCSCDSGSEPLVSIKDENCWSAVRLTTPAGQLYVKELLLMGLF